MKHRKSTSDLTNEENENATASTSAPKHRRRGSSKGGLAYLVEKRDSRRGSRDSVMSQQTNVSNEDIGPLTNFQQTQRGRQRRTSNFLELPGKLFWPRHCEIQLSLHNLVLIMSSINLRRLLLSLASQSQIMFDRASARYPTDPTRPTIRASARTYIDCALSPSAKARWWTAGTQSFRVGRAVTLPSTLPPAGEFLRTIKYWCIR